jgi:hypothetical protein
MSFVSPGPRAGALLRSRLLGAALVFSIAEAGSVQADAPKKPLSQALTGSAKADFESAKLAIASGEPRTPS